MTIPIMTNMKDLHQALGVFLKYLPAGGLVVDGDMISAPGTEAVTYSDEDCERLDKLGWYRNEPNENWRTIIE